jgi:S-methylmethionine-dependent homocysteine/selenocysteine methylase
MCLRNGEPLLDALACLADADIPLVSIMHTEVAHIDDCLDIIEKHWQGLTGVYAHVGRYADGNWHFDFTITPDDYAAHSHRWIERNVQIIGGCCGIMPDHISALSTIG